MTTLPPIDTSEANLAYITSLKPGELVVEMGQSGMRGARGVVYESTDGGGTCVRWDCGQGCTMGTSVTWGTRRQSDIPEDQWGKPPRFDHSRP